MTSPVTQTEVGPIRHRPGTPLSHTLQCSQGHLAPRYTKGGKCVVCAKLQAYQWFAINGRLPVERQLQGFSDYAVALERHLDIGGWLLSLGADWYGCTDNPRVVGRLRGRAWMDHCDIIGCWDEVALAAHGSRAQRA